MAELVTPDDDSDFKAELEERNQTGVDERKKESASTAAIAQVNTPLHQHAKAFDNAESDRIKQANSLRKWFFWVATGLASCCVVTSAIVAVWVTMVHGVVNTGIIVAFVSGLSVQALGMMFIIAGYLFPKGVHKTA